MDPRQVELQQLQREYRHMEINRRQYADESQAVLRKQQQTIDKLRKDNDVVKSDIATVMRGSNKVLTIEQQEMLSTLNEQGDKYANQIEFERKNLLILDEQLAIMKEKELQQRKSMGGVNASRENYNMIQKQIRILENRLDKSLIKFNESMQFNKTLRFEIDNLRRERVVFENIYRKMERDLQDKKKAMAEIIETSNQFYEQRDSFQMEIAAIEQANRKEQEEFDEQMNTLARLLDTELQMPGPSGSGFFNNTHGTADKDQRGASSHSSLPRLDPKGNTSNNNNNNKINNPSSSQGGRFRHTKSAGALLNNSSSAASLDSTGGGGGNDPSSPTKEPFEIDYRERAQNFEEAFNRIKAATGIADIDELVKTFIQSEEHNFSLFNYVNEQNNEIEKLEEQIAALREEEMKYAQESGNDVNQHKEILKDLETKLLSTDNLAEKYEIRCQDLGRIIESLKRGLQRIFSLFFQENQWSSADALGFTATGTHKETITDPESGTSSGNNSNLGEPPVISEVNMVNYLGVLEKKTNELLQAYRNIQSSLTQTAANDELANTVAMASSTTSKGGVTIQHAPMYVSVLGTGPKTPMGQEHLHVNPPKADDFYRLDKDNQASLNNSNNFGHDDIAPIDEEEEEETRPLTRDELKYRTLSRIQRRLQGSNGTTSKK
jgi:coiled-coil domain-containing protein 63/114